VTREIDLRQAPLFTGMTSNDLATLARVGHRLAFLPGETVFSGPIRDMSLFVVGSGEVDVFRREADGSMTLLARLGPGESFGEVAMLDGRPRHTIGLARGAVACWSLDRPAYERLRQAYPDTATRLLLNASRHMAERLVRASAQLNLAADRPAGTPVTAMVAEARRSLWDRLRGR
jgi:CRP-like cAMP-binding protein